MLVQNLLRSSTQKWMQKQRARNKVARDTIDPCTDDHSENAKASTPSTSPTRAAPRHPTRRHQSIEEATIYWRPLRRSRRKLQIYPRDKVKNYTSGSCLLLWHCLLLRSSVYSLAFTQITMSHRMRPDALREKKKKKETRSCNLTIVVLLRPLNGGHHQTQNRRTLATFRSAVFTNEQIEICTQQNQITSGVRQCMEQLCLHMRCPQEDLQKILHPW